ncbi:hypothetical protein WUBG_06448 [Wuchereria bancrofti]|uniref:Uncharacterized protein n=1 Tax=Wuchereria bancrofti TaxID=6293 RepID=J9EZK4_WUCBA|nr:hypothetical protein WUBG_06448 [Wuchereria bancrofti]
MVPISCFISSAGYLSIKWILVKSTLTNADAVAIPLPPLTLSLPYFGATAIAVEAEEPHTYDNLTMNCANW